MIELRRFDAAARREVRRDAVPPAFDAAVREVGLGDGEMARRLVARARLPLEAGDVVAAIFVIERRIKADGRDVDRLRPRTHDIVSTHGVCFRVEFAARHVLHMRVDEPELLCCRIIGKMRRPDAGRRVRPLEVHLAVLQEIRQEFPVHEVCGVEDLHGRLPVERRGRDVIIVTNAQNRRIRRHTRDDRVQNRCHRNFLLFVV